MKRALFVLSLVLSACTSAPTQLRVEVDTDFDVPLELDRIDVNVRDESGTVRSAHPFEVLPSSSGEEAGKYRLPISFAVVPIEGRESARVTIELLGRHGDAEPLVRRVARIGFVDGRTLPLRLFLARACQDTSCGDGLTCDRGVCVPIDVDMMDAGMPADGDVSMDGASDDGVVDSGPSCQDGELVCGSRCRDVLNDPLYCGDCDTRCGLGQNCNSGHCETVSDCRMSGMSCSGLSYCDASNGLCTPGCASATQCTSANETCDTVSHECVCAPGAHDCGGSCALNSSVNSCGSDSCSPCPTDPNGTTGCNGTSCTLSCNAGSLWCGGSCALCPTEEHVTSSGCGSGATCVATACSSGYMPCETGCCAVSDCNTIPCTGFTYCDTGSGMCLSGCASSAQCSGGQECNTSSHACSCSSAQRLCDGSCALCPTGVGIMSTECLGTECVAASCATGYDLVDGACLENIVTSVSYIKASNPGSDDEFGYSIAISADGNTMAIGAPSEDANANSSDTVPSVADTSTSDDFGAVYIFRRIGGTWTQERYLKASVRVRGNSFGASVALSGDGNVLLVGAPNETRSGRTGSGVMYYYTRTGSTWSTGSLLYPTNTEAFDAFGASIALSADGRRAVVGSPGEDCSITGVQPPTSATINNSASDSGAAYIYEFGTTTNVYLLKASNAQANDEFGEHVAISADGNTVAVGAIAEDSSAIGVDGDQSNNGELESGAVYVFRRSGSWMQDAYVKASNAEAGDRFGSAVALSADGNTLAVGAMREDSEATGVDGDQSDNTATDSGAVYVLRRAATWTQEAYLKAAPISYSGDVGASLSISNDGDALAVGAPRRSSGAGQIVLFEYGSSWTQAGVWGVTPFDWDDRLGAPVCISGDGTAIAMGALREDGSSPGVDGDDTDNSASNSGAVYVFGFE